MVLVGLGSNRGQSLEIVVRAMEELETFAQPGTFERSSLWRTSPVDCPEDADDFINAAVGFSPNDGLTPEELLRSLKALERKYGREDSPIKNAPRELDLDLLLYNEETRSSEGFTLPHPRAHERLFVLAPVNEISSTTMWPNLGKSTGQLLRELETDEKVEKV